MREKEDEVAPVDAQVSHFPVAFEYTISRTSLAWTERSGGPKGSHDMYRELFNRKRESAETRSRISIWHLEQSDPKWEKDKFHARVRM